MSTAGPTPVEVSRAVPGVDCASVPVCAFAPRAAGEPDEHAWTSSIGPRRVQETPEEWFYLPRSAQEGFAQVFGDDWRIDFLPSTEDGDGFALLTHWRTGGRLLSRLPGEANGWCGDPGMPMGEDLSEEPRRQRARLAEVRRAWLRGRAFDAVDTPDLRAMIAAVGVRPDQFRPAPGESLEQAWLLCGGLIEVWLAEHGYTGARAAAVRTMLSLGGLSVLDAYGSSHALTA